MNDAEKESLSRVLQLQAVSVEKHAVAELTTRLRALGALFDMPRLRTVVSDDADAEARLVLLHEKAGVGAAAAPAASRCLCSAVARQDLSACLRRRESCYAPEVCSLARSR